MAELDVKERQAGDVTILDLSGEVRIGEGSIALRDSIRNLADQGKKNVLLNLRGVKYIDSTGIGVPSCLLCSIPSTTKQKR
jgi:anti-sigma B factor antagonist